MGLHRGRFAALSWLVPVLLLAVLLSSAAAQGVPSLTGATPQGPAFLNSFGPPGSAYRGPVSSDVVPISSGLFGRFLPRIPNLELGFVYAIGPNLKAGRAIADYVLPISLSSSSVVFGEAHAELQDFWKSQRVTRTTGPGSITFTAPATNRTDLSFGGGYRTILGGNTLVGVNAFFDTTKVFQTWYSAGGVGLEMVANLTDNDAVDLRANWYGNLFSRDVFINAFRNKGQSYDVGAGFNHGIFDQAFDLRLSFTGYQFGIGSAVYGYKTGADLTTRDGVLSLKYEHGYDRVNGSYDTIGGFVNVGFQVENIFRGESPINLPDPVFNSPRSLTWWLTRQVKRNWHQPTAIVQSRTGALPFTSRGTGCDRFLASVSMSPLGGGNFLGDEPFTAFPRSSLDPTKYIVVEFDYTFDVAPSGGTATWDVCVIAPFPLSTACTEFVGDVPTGQSGHMAFTLNSGDSQNAYIVADLDPDGLEITVSGGPASTLTITNVCIRFNQ